MTDRWGIWMRFFAFILLLFTASGCMQLTLEKEVRYIAERTVSELPLSKKYSETVQRYRQRVDDPEAVPLIDVGEVVNDTDCADLNIGVLKDIFEEVLSESSSVALTAALDPAISRENNLRRQCMPDERGMLKAPLLRAVIRISTHPKDGGLFTRQKRYISVKIVECHRGTLVWRCGKRF